MKKIKKAQNKFTSERTENLMLMALFAEKAIQQEALAELRNRRNGERPESMPDCYFTNIGGIPS